MENPETILTENKNNTFYNPGTLKLVLLSTLTLGFYDLYWSYENWKGIKKTEGTEISPFWRTVFLGIFIFPLAKRITRSAEQAGKTGVLPYIPVTITFVIFSLLMVTETSKLDLLSLLTVAPLAYLQSLANYSNKQLHNLEPNYNYSKTAEIWMAIGVVLFAFIIWDYLA